MNLRVYTRQIIKRAGIVGILIAIAFFLNSLFSGFEQDILGAAVFILLFSISLLYYYTNLFKGNEIHRNEFILSIISVFFLTIVIFAFIYAEPIDDQHNYFIEDGMQKNLTFSDSLYFSATTISTLGSDINPKGIFRFFVVTEVFFGLIYTGTMLYFITRELEKNREGKK